MKFYQVKVSLLLFMNDQGILRRGGHFENFRIPFDASFPIFLPRLSRFTDLVISVGYLKPGGPLQRGERYAYRAHDSG